MTLMRLLFATLALAGALSGQALDAVFVLESSSGTEQTTGLIRARSLDDEDRAGLVAFVKTAHLIQPLTANHEEWQDAVRASAGRLGGGGGGGGLFGTNLSVNLAPAIHMACAELVERGAPDHKRAIVLFFAGEDTNLSLHLDSLRSALDSANARLYAVVITRVASSMTPGMPRTPGQPPSVGSPPFGGTSTFPTVTARLVEELAEGSGGRIFKRNWDLKKILKEARRP